MGSPVHTSSGEPPLLTRFGLPEPALEMEFTAHFARRGGEVAAGAATAAVTGSSRHRRGSWPPCSTPAGG
ncbi:hypothetical protein QF037_001363 [Streptomyces canus]|uniref:hypothetical protein n=1 Tax=Streptomyces canus TaxID=58343 RepID=UPI00278B98B3|nr:hypothetical protein [Streptomyces canus]MDQ0597018.1 hypothetical protein [Streptomyces canus]